jgi:hypothetical protein
MKSSNHALSLQGWLLVLFFNYEFPVAISYRELTRPRTGRILSVIEPRNGHASQETHVPWPLPTAAWRHRGHGKHSLLYCCVLDRVYRAVTWQRVDQIRYNIYIYIRVKGKYNVTSSSRQLQQIREAADGFRWLLFAGILLGLLDPEDWDMFLRNVVWLSIDCTAMSPIRQTCSQPPVWKP